MVSDEEINVLYNKLKNNAKTGGYNLNPDVDFTKELVKGLLENKKRYGYQACPCRLAEGDKKEDLDIICPCDYRDKDLEEYDTCYCSLYVSKQVVSKEKKISSIPERRPSKEKRAQFKEKKENIDKSDSFSKPVWRCRVCGYLCARDKPPEICPICKAKKERFEKFF